MKEISTEMMGLSRIIKIQDLSPPSISVKPSSQRRFRGKNGACQKEQLYHAEDFSCCFHAVFAFSHDRKEKNRRDRQHDPSADIPDPADVLMGKFPGIPVLHGHGGAVSVQGGDFCRRMLQEAFAEDEHCDWNEKVHEQHKNPE